LKFFLASSAKINSGIWQYDLIQAYVFIKLPDYWKHHVPPELQKYIGIPLELLKALYGVSFSGLLLYEALAEFLTT
jgi:hypothetical protein